MTPTAKRIADLHADAFGAAGAHGWGESDFARALADPRYVIEVTHDGYAVALVTLDEAELVLIGVSRQAQKSGIGRRILTSLHDRLQERGVLRVFLEVAETNDPAKALYASAGYRQTGRRPGYYSGGRVPVDALLYEKTIEPGAHLPL